MTRLLPPMMFLICIGLALLLHNLPLSAPELLRYPYTLVGLILMVPGIGLSVVGSLHFQKKKTNINTFLPPDMLVTDGLFSISRNPMYLGFLIAIVGVCTLLGSTLSYVSALVLFLSFQWWYIPFEENICHRIFGQDYKNYKARVRRWI